MSKSFTHAGVSKLDGEFKVRFANDALRVKVLAKNGHKDIDIIELKHAMNKEDAVAFLISIDFDNGNKEVRAALEAEVGKRTETPKAAPKAKASAKAKPTMKAIEAKVAAKKAAPKSTVSKAEVVAQLADLEDAPY
jgi:predicted neutral ceramidase superfamily lipid hydrolase